MPLSSLIFAPLYYGTLLLFAVWSGAVSVIALVASWRRATQETERGFRRLIHRQFALFLWWLRLTRLVRVEYRGWERIPAGPSVVVANHPGLLDITYLLARVPNAICIFKGALRRNPLLGAAARRAGYIANDSALDLVRGTAEKIAAGATLVVFPEGTRTPVGGALGPFRPGFAGIARRANVPLQLVRITCEQELLGKRRRWWKLQQLPARVVVQAGPRLSADVPASTAALVAEVEAWFRDSTLALESASKPSASRPELVGSPSTITS